MLIDVVDHEIIGSHERLYAITLRRRIFCPVEIAVPHFRSRGLIEPDMISVRIQRFDVLHPIKIRIVNFDA